MEWLLDPTLWIGLLTLVILEIVLGIDNLIFIAILAGKLPPRERDKARLIGLALALIMRLALISALSWLVTLTQPLVTLYSFTFSGRDLILLFGGLFLLYKATTELHERLEGKIHPQERSRVFAGFWVVVAQIVVLDAVFSLDSVILAIGVVDHLYMMMIAITIAMAIMMVASKPLTNFVNGHPTIIILCLSFLLMVGLSLLSESIGFKIPKEYIYAAIGFSVVIEFLNQIAQRNFTKNIATIPLRERTAEAVLRLLGSRPRTEMDMEEEEDNQEAEPYVFGIEERNMVSGVLTLGERSIRSIMTPRNEVSWINLDDDINAIQETLRSTSHSVFPVCREQLDNLIGIGQAKDLLEDIHTSGKINEETSLRSPIVLPESAGVLQAMDILKQSHGKLVLVADEYGTIQGLMTPIDILEAIAGEFPNEDEQPEVQQLGPNSWKINGAIDLYYLEQVLETDAMIDANSEYSSLAGFLLERFGTVPEVGQTIQWNDLRFEVAEMDERRIAQVLVNRISSREEEEERPSR